MNDFLLKRFKKLKISPQIAIITGSGIKLFRDKESIFEIKYSKLPVIARSKATKQSHKHYKDYKIASLLARNDMEISVKGHEGVLKLYKIKNKDVIVFSGRHHLYEGLNILEVTANVRLAYNLGIQKIIITNAAGGINTNFQAGDLMLITGFIDLMQSTERGILSGITQPPYKIRTNLTTLISKTFKGKIKSGIYAGVLGPSYETFAEIKLLKSLGASAVGMSTIPEIICAKSLGMDYAGISVISNVWTLNHKPSHKDVLEQVKKANEKLDNLILEAING